MRPLIRVLSTALLALPLGLATTPAAGAAKLPLPLKQLPPALKKNTSGGYSIRVTARTSPRARCYAVVRVKKIRQRLRTIEASKRGRAAWRWQILTNSPSGNWTITTTCRQGKRKASSSRRVLVVTNSRSSRGSIGNPNSLEVLDGEPAGRGGASCGPFTDRSLPGNGKQCTCLAWEKRRDVYDTSVARGVSASGWNGSRWLVNAQRGGFPTGATPAKGALVVWGTLAASDYGHVAYVENVESPTRIQISECNYDWKGSCRTVWINPRARANLQGYVYGGTAVGGRSPSTGQHAATGILARGMGMPAWRTAGDFTGDGKADLLYQDPGSTKVYLLTSNGSAFTLTTWATGIGHAAWQQPGDINGDGKTDLIYQDAGSTDIRVIYSG